MRSVHVMYQPLVKMKIFALIFVVMTVTTGNVSEGKLVTCNFEEDFCSWDEKFHSNRLISTLSLYPKIVCGIKPDSCDKMSIMYDRINWERKYIPTSIHTNYWKGTYVVSSGVIDPYFWHGTFATLIGDLVSAVIPASWKERCLTFTYHVAGKSIFNLLYTNDKTLDNNMEIIHSFNVTKTPTKFSAVLPIGEEFRIVFRSVLLKYGDLGEILLDDIQVNYGHCIDVCSDDQYHCEDNHCIDVNLVCDGTPHCPDRSDEYFCDKVIEQHNLLEICIGSEREKDDYNCSSAKNTLNNLPGKKLDSQPRSSPTCVVTALRVNIPYTDIKNCSQERNCSEDINSEMCYLACPVNCVCDGLTFRCLSTDIPKLARSIHVTGVDLKTNNFNLQAYKHLVILKLTWCGLETFNSSTFPAKLQYLDLSNNALSSVSFLLEINPILLIIDNNPLVQFKFAYATNIGLTNLRFIQARNTSLQEVTFYRHRHETARLYSDFSYTGIHYSMVGDISSVVNLSYNNINDKRIIAASQVIDLRHNSLESFTVYPTTVILHLQYNRLYEFLYRLVLFSSPPFELRYLDLSYNNLTEINTWASFHLGFLNLRGNRISNLKNIYLKESLKFLDLSENSLHYLNNFTFKGLSKLENLLLRQNAINNIDSGIFSDLAQLKTLDLAENNMKYIGKGSFIGLSNLKILEIHGNSFHVWDEMFDGLSSLTYLHVHSYTICCAKPITVTDENCASPVDDISSCDQLIDVPVLGVCIWYISLIAIFGNLSVIIYRLWFISSSHSKTQTTFIINLSFSDLLMGVYLYIISITDVLYKGKYGLRDFEWRNGKVCIFAGILATTSSETSAMLLLLITVDRVIAVKRSMGEKKINKSMAKVMSGGAWVVAVIISSVPAVSRNYFNSIYSKSGICISLPLSANRDQGWEFSMAVFVIFNLLIFVGILLGQMIIFQEVRHSGGSIRSTVTRQREIALAKTLFMLVLTDMCCWMPIGVIGVLTFFGIQVPSIVYAWIVVVVLPLNSALNPVLYTMSVFISEKKRESQKFRNMKLEIDDLRQRVKVNKEKPRKKRF